jgi:hypothetical protein
VRIAKPDWAPGQHLCVTEGPFAGLNAIYSTRSGTERVIVLPEWLRAERPVERPERALAVTAA